MSQANFDAMSGAELKQYFLANRQDQSAFQAYLDRFSKMNAISLQDASD
ncbi:MAG: hypothetical protein AAF215_01245 [Cyanobacteria bacterium P01_A01_bin.123]